MKEATYGYLIEDDIHVDVKLGAVAKFYSSRKLKSYTVEVVFLGETSMRLLIYLLERAESDVVPYTDILRHVWDDRGLVSSYKRLNQVVADLRGVLRNIGLMEEIILTVRSEGYRLNSADIKRIYIKSIKSRVPTLARVL